MSMDASLLVAVALAVLAGLLFVLSRRMRRAAGLPAGRVIYADTGAWQRNEQALYSERHRLAGKPDYLVRQGGRVIPVEVKSGPAPDAPHEGHLLQLAAYCLLVAETSGNRPPYGILQYADRQYAIDYTAELEGRLRDALRRLRDDADADAARGPRRSHAAPERCARCGVRDSCDQRLA
jgi:CRISPR-associated exonuclease Cas4